MKFKSKVLTAAMALFLISRLFNGVTIGSTKHPGVNFLAVSEDGTTAYPVDLVDGYCEILNFTNLLH